MKYLLTMTLAAGFALAAPPTVKSSPVEIPAENASRIVYVGERDVVPVATRVRYTTVIILPKEETVLKALCGDREFWSVDGSENMVFVKPAKADASTNLNLITAAGNVYSFTLREGNAIPDLKLFIEPKDGGNLITSLKAQAPQFVAATAVDDYRQQVQMARAEAAKAKEDAQTAIAEAEKRTHTEVAMAKAGLPASLKHDYKFGPAQNEFDVRTIYHNEHFTFIEANPQETPVLYEEKDGKPKVVQFAFADGLYTVPKIIDKGYLQIGKKKLNFYHVEK
jgi:hypothetical protein